MYVLSEPLPTIGRVRETHLDLMRNWRDLDSDAARAAEAEALRANVAKAGRGINDPKERFEAQGILDYWASSIASLPDRALPSFIELDPYEGEAAKNVGRNAAEIYAELESEEDRRIARALFEELMERGERGYVKRPAPLRATLRSHIGGKDFDKVVDAYIDGGAIVRLPGTTPGEERLEVSDVQLSEEWPELRDWLDSLANYAAFRDFLVKSADEWKRAGYPRSRLISDPAQLAQLDRYRDETELVDDFISKSRSAYRWGWWRNLIAAGFCLAIIATLVAIAVVARQQASEAANSASADAAVGLGNSVGPQTIGKGDLTPANSTAPASSGPLAIVGALWLGSDAAPQVVTPTGGAPSLASAAAGSSFRLRTNIFLRQAWPESTDNYTSPPSISVVPAGSLVYLTSDPKGYDRPSGRQYWAQVRVVPRVYVQYAGFDPGAIQALRKRLATAGFDVPPAQNIPTASTLREIRYFDQADAGLASYLAETLAAAPLGQPGGFACRSFAESRVQGQRYVLEIWVGEGAGRHEGPTPAC